MMWGKCSDQDLAERGRSTAVDWLREEDRQALEAVSATVKAWAARARLPCPRARPIRRPEWEAVREATHTMNRVLDASPDRLPEAPGMLFVLVDGGRPVNWGARSSGMGQVFATQRLTDGQQLPPPGEGMRWRPVLRDAATLGALYSVAVERGFRPTEFSAVAVANAFGALAAGHTNTGRLG